MNARSIRIASVRVWRGVAALHAELLTSTATLLGWTLITFGIADLTAPVAWSFSIGLLLLLLCGWRLLWRVFRDGLYDLTRGSRE